MNEIVSKNPLRLVVALSIVVGLCLSGDLAIDMFDYFNIENSTLLTFRIFLNALFWFSFVLLVGSVYFFSKYKSHYERDKNTEALILLGFVVAISALARYGLSGLEFYMESNLLPLWLSGAILISLFLLGMFYVLSAVYIFIKN